MARSIDILDLRVRSLDIDFNEISWRVEGHGDVLDYTFQMMRSESPLGPFEPLAPPFEDQYLFVDNRLPAGYQWRQLYYQLRLTDKRSNEQTLFGPVAHEADPDIMALEIRRHIQLLMAEFVGRRCWVLPIRTFGPRCSCWSTTLNKITRSGCRLCYQTGFIRGYWRPIEVWVQIDPSAKTKQTSSLAVTSQANTTARCGYFPSLKPDDVLVEFENRRWRVVKVSATEKGRAILHQELELHEIPKSDVEYSIPLNMDESLRNLWASPAGNYAHSTNLESFEKLHLQNIFANYRNPR